MQNLTSVSTSSSFMQHLPYCSSFFTFKLNNFESFVSKLDSKWNLKECYSFPPRRIWRSKSHFQSILVPEVILVHFSLFSSSSCLREKLIIYSFSMKENSLVSLVPSGIGTIVLANSCWVKQAGLWV